MSVSDESVESPDPVGLFFSIFPDRLAAIRIARVLEDLRRQYRLRGRPLLTTRFHSSLYGFDSRDAASPIVVAKAREAAAIVRATPFRVSFDCARSFSRRDGRHLLVLTGEDGVVGLTRLSSSLCAAMREMRVRRKGCPVFTPHVTLTYNGCCLDEQPIEPVSWTVRDFVLVRSLIGRTKYVELGRWQLRG